MAVLTEYTIIIGKTPTFSVRNAASFLQQEIKLICGKTIPVLYDTEPLREREIVLGPTSRELYDGLSFIRGRERLYEYEIISVGERLYMTGLGTSPEKEPYRSSYKMWDDGQCATLYAVYYFVETVLRHDFLNSAFSPYVERLHLNMPLPFRFSYTKEAMSAQLPQKIEGTALYAIPASAYFEFGMTCLIFKSKTGEFVLLDGGHAEDAEHVISCLEFLSDCKKPVIAAWLFSHLHTDHYGLYSRVYEDKALRERITVRDVYAHLFTEEEYKAIRDTMPSDLDARDMILSCDTIGARYHQISVGTHINIGEFSFEILRVPNINSSELRQMNMNDSSVVYRMDCAGQRILLPGDGEWITNRDLENLPQSELKCDALQVAHHGVGNLSLETYKRIGAKYYLWQCANRFYYSDEGEGVNSKNLGVIRTRMYINEVGGAQRHYRDTNGILSLKLPLDHKS